AASADGRRSTKKARRASYCRCAELEGSRKRRANVSRSLELSSMLPRCHPGQESVVDSLMLRGKPLEFQGKVGTRKRSYMRRMIRLTFWMTDRSFLVSSNKEDRGNG